MERITIREILKSNFHSEIERWKHGIPIENYWFDYDKAISEIKVLIKKNYISKEELLSEGGIEKILKTTLNLRLLTSLGNYTVAYCDYKKAAEALSGKVKRIGR